jgi:pimeloyl-ACP methyl ester carboxylesterase
VLASRVVHCRRVPGHRLRPARLRSLDARCGTIECTWPTWRRSLSTWGAPAHVFDWSSGGSTALALASERPELCRCVVVVEATWHGLRYATGDVLGVCGRLKLAQLRGHRREAAAIFFRWVSGLRDGRNGFDVRPVAEQDVLLANGRAVLVEIDGHPFGPLMEYMSTKKLAAIRVPITWLLGTETQASCSVSCMPRLCRCRRTFGASTRLDCDG